MKIKKKKEKEYEYDKRKDNLKEIMTAYYHLRGAKNFVTEKIQNSKLLRGV
jgi:hypothetical protein